MRTQNARRMIHNLPTEASLQNSVANSGLTASSALSSSSTSSRLSTARLTASLPPSFEEVLEEEEIEVVAPLPAAAAVLGWNSFSR